MTIAADLMPGSCVRPVAVIAVSLIIPIAAITAAVEA
jgi:hypothetical protein